MTAYRYANEIKRILGSDLSALELEDAMRMCGEGKTTQECARAIQAKRDRKAKGKRA